MTDTENNDEVVLIEALSLPADPSIFIDEVDVEVDQEPVPDMDDDEL